VGFFPHSFKFKKKGMQLQAVEVEKLQGGAEVVPPPPAAGSELVKKYHVLLHL
jgi:hypothetical protein